VNALATVIGYHLEKSAPTCGICGNDFDAVAARQSLEQLRGWELRIQQSPSTYHANDLDRMNQEIARLHATVNAFIQFPGEMPAMSLADAESQLLSLCAAKGAHDQYYRLKEAVTALEATATRWKALSVVLDSLVKDFVDAGMVKLMVRVQQFLATDDVFGMKLTKSDCQIGFIRDEVLVTALSGAEWARLLVAIACACASSGTPVIIPEERMWDRATLGRTMRALSKAPCQVILTSTEKPKGKIPAGWSVVEIGQI
jgi:hypothetical protein